MVSLAQLVRASDCGSEGRGFDPHTSPSEEMSATPPLFYYTEISVAVETDGVSL